MLFSGTDDKLQAAAVLTVGAGRKVNVFLQYWALDALRADRIMKGHGVASEAGEEGLRAMQCQGKTHWSELFRQSKDLGEVRLFACADSMETFHITKDDLDPLVGGVWGVASFFAEADGPATSSSRCSSRTKEVGTMTTTAQVARSIDARGMPCPGPLMSLIGAIRQGAVGDVIEVLSSDEGLEDRHPRMAPEVGTRAGGG